VSLRRPRASLLLAAVGLWAVPGIAAAAAFPCTEQGVLDAVALGGGPHTFQCVGPTVVVMAAEIVPDVYAKLDGGGDLTLDGNDAHRLFSVPSNVTLELQGLTLTHGVATEGGAVLVDGTLVLEDVTVEDNTATGGVGGGGILNRGDLVVRSSRILGNTAVSGGGISTSGVGHDEFISDSTIADNDASSVGGGMVLCNGSIDRTTFSGNTASTGGGAYWDDSSTCVFTNTTVSGNHTDGTGGGIRTDDGSIELLNVTIADNTATGGISALALNCCDFATLENVLVSGGCANSMAVTTSVGGSIESPGDGCGFYASTDQVNVPAMSLLLGPLADNAGPTETQAPQPGSPAIDGGVLDDCPDGDQRGMPRPIGAGCDTGAVELPEPSQAALLLAGLAGLWGCHRRRRARSRGRGGPS
jgi:hypothetical protein